MKINKKSWHFKVVNSFPETLPSNLCDYTKTLLKAFGLVLLVLALASFFVYSWVVIVGSFSKLGWKMFENGVFSNFEAGAISMAIALTIVLLIVGFAVFAFYIHEFLEKRPHGLVRQWLKARKEKTCPRIEYTEE